MKYNKVAILGTGVYLPDNVVTNKDIENNIDTTDDWIQKKLGIKERRVSTETETTSEMAYKASIDAINNAKITKEEIDLIIVATSSPDQISPSTACVLHNKLGIKRNIPSFDLNAVCSGFVYAFSLASDLVNNGVYKNILIVASETYSKHTDWDDRHCVFFGDGAGAVVLSTSHNGWAHSELSSNGSGTGMTGFKMPLDKSFIMMGKEVWDQAIKVLPESIKSITNSTNTDVNDIKMLIPHQPSINILKIIAKSVGLPMTKVKTIMDKYGNIAGASVPIALHEAITNNEIECGDKIVLTAIGSGWAWGSILIKYDNK